MSGLSPFFVAYIAAWSAACLLALIVYLRDVPAFAFSHRGYWNGALAAAWCSASCSTAGRHCRPTSRACGASSG
jgi:hypothetical protein